MSAEYMTGRECLTALAIVGQENEYPWDNWYIQAVVVSYIHWAIAEVLKVDDYQEELARATDSHEDTLLFPIHGEDINFFFEVIRSHPKNSRRLPVIEE